MGQASNNGQTACGYFENYWTLDGLFIYTIGAECDGATKGRKRVLGDSCFSDALNWLANFCGLDADVKTIGRWSITLQSTPTLAALVISNVMHKDNVMNAARVPAKSILRKRLDTAYFCDCFEMPIKNNDRSALELYLGAVRHTPKWIDFLMELRNRVVALFGLKDLGQLSDVEKAKDPASYKVGDRVGIFSIVAMTDQEVVLGDADKRLNAQVSVYKHSEPDRRV
jgi:hypothetical protein